MRLRPQYVFVIAVVVAIGLYFIVRSLFGLGHHATADAKPAPAGPPSVQARIVPEIQRRYDVVVRGRTQATRTVVVRSETAGVVHEAADSALLVSPLDIEGTAQALAAALDLPAAERASRLARFQARIERWTAGDWLRAQLADLGLEGALVGGGRGRGRAIGGSRSRKRAGTEAPS